MKLNEKPFYLTEEDNKWIKETMDKMSIDDKIKQLFVDMIAPVANRDFVKGIIGERKFGGIRYMNKDPKSLQELISLYQEESQIPLIVAANTEAGGNGACKGGTEVGQEVMIAATNDKKYAYELGRISGLEASAIGCNTLFAPIVDIHKNWRSPIISSRTFGNDPKKVLEYSLEYLRGAHETGVACFCKHFPGDGIDERDQHLANSLNNLSVEEWDDSFGYVYKGMIDAGVEGIMIGHILLPAYEKYFNPELQGSDFMPATLSPYLLKDLLRDKLGFKGVTITDASHMVGMTGRMKRKDIVPTAIMSGCDMFLFYNDYAEDFGFVKQAYEEGRLTLERINEAVERILAYKAHLHLQNGVHTSVDALANIGLESSKQIANEVAHKAITLVKNNEKDVLPLSPSKTKRVLLIHHDISNPFNTFAKGAAGQAYFEVVKNGLEAEGFDVEVYTTILEQMKKASDEEIGIMMNKLYTSKSAIKTLTDKYDLVIHLANVPGNGLIQRIDFALTKGSIDIPWYSHELPVIFISVNSPFHLFDVPNVQTYINCYGYNDETMRALVNKLVGKEKFEGVSPVDAFCGSEDTRW